jgi:AraC-like DNA-binding protein
MNELFIFMRGAGFGLAVLLCVKLVLEYRSLWVGRALLGMFVGLSAYIVLPFFQAWAGIRDILVVAAIAVPALFWLFTLALFRDWDRRGMGPGGVHLAVVAVFMVLALASYWVGRSGPLTDSDSPLRWALFYASYLFRVGLLVLSLAVVVAEWQQDLVESRRRLRTILVAGGGAYMLATVCAELLLGERQAPLVLELWHSLFLLLILLLASLWLLPRNDSLSATLDLPHNAGSPKSAKKDAGSPAREAAPELSFQEQNWLEELRDFMETRQGYHQPELTIRLLGVRLNIPEHRLRRLINRHLGFRNFSDYLNSYRLTEAAARLADPAQGELPVLSIALDVGYASLTPFNRAFKARFGVTPSAWRSNRVAGSGD